MDVEAQDDGVLAKIVSGDGSKSIKVGTRIAVTAEPGDDLTTLEIPADESSAPAATSSPPSQSSDQPSPTEQHSSSPAAPPGNGSPQKYPLYPSVLALLREHSVPESDADRIPATGPNNRLLKGDVLSYLNKIPTSYSSEQSSRIQHLGHLDLSNIQPAVPKPKPAAPVEPEKTAPPPPPPDTEVAVPISLTAVLATQKRMKDALGITLPLSTFIARASELANEDLPRAKGRGPTMEELYDSVVGLDSVRRTSRGRYVPRVMPVQTENVVVAPRKRAPEDVIDALTGVGAPRAKRVPLAAAVAPGEGTNVFSVMAKSGEERRARTYLERVKTVLESEPARVVL